MGGCLIESMARYIGQTVTIFTKSGGLSGNGFTGVLAGICDGCVKLITDIGAPPACPLGSSCCGGFPEWGGGFEGGCRCGAREGACGRACTCGFERGGFERGGYGRGYGRFGMGWNWLGSVTVIPCESIASFTHNAI
ncbi:MAG: hypothetical protein FWD19_03980 [Defluviitaleaceae bacterium]|nr:hypothetical protein [Defluviitaleaceae bacterium]